MLYLGAKLKVEFFLKNLDFTKTLLLDLREMNKRTLEILACFFLAELSKVIIYPIQTHRLKEGNSKP